MKKIIISLIVLSSCLKMFSQNSVDSSFVTMITAVNWMPDGKALLLNIVKFDKTRKVQPVFGGYTFNLDRKKLELLGFAGSSRVPHHPMAKD